ncbi:MAG: J domain-containing protein [Oscillibacter sp.]|nr:J domain-containing protein [Oscillibacter sp.]
MKDMWKILGLEPTEDTAAIKRAYAQKARTCHPEEDPEGFLALRNAYQAALRWAETGGEEPPDEAPDLPDTDADSGWDLTGAPRPPEDGPNPYAGGEAIETFLALYTGKQRKNPTQWLDYFTSAPFLDAAWDRRFTVLLLEQVDRLEGEFQVPREFLNWLCVAYQFRVNKQVYMNPDGSERVEFRFEVYQGAQFEGIESVFEIAKKGPAPRDFKGNELGVLQSYYEYRALCRMADAGVWDEQAVGAFSQIIGCYAAGYITDKCQQRRDVDYERHPAGVRLMAHFLRREGLPEELYRIAWQKLDLKTALMGKAKLLYGDMRAVTAERFPEVAGEKRESFAKLKSESFAVFADCYKRGETDPQRNIDATDALFAREDFQRALLDRRFVEEEMLHTWVNEDRCDYYLKRVIDFYEAHPSAPCARKVIDRAREMQKIRDTAARVQADREAEASENAVTLKNSAFFRHWINTGFYSAWDPASRRTLLSWLNDNLPFLPDWGKAFLNVEGDSIPEPACVTCALGGDAVEVRFHLRCMSFLLNGQPVYRACLDWDRVAALTDTDSFFFLLPLAAATYDRCEAVKAELLRRLPETAAPQEGWDLIAACLADQICSLPLPGEVGLEPEYDGEEDDLRPRRQLPPESVLPFEVFAEDADRLYGCTWDQRGEALMLFEQLPIGRQPVRGGRCDEVPDAESAMAMARQLLEEALAPQPFPMHLLTVFPEAVFWQWDFGVLCRMDVKPLHWEKPPRLLGADIETDRLEDLLEQFAQGLMLRLELSWHTVPPVGEATDRDFWRSLVLMKGPNGYVCLYFDDTRAESCALLERPELYGKLKERVQFVNFRNERIFRTSLHRSFASIRRRMGDVFKQVSYGTVQPHGLWEYAINVTHGRTKYNLEKQLLGDFPPERARNALDAPFFFAIHPDTAAIVEAAGTIDRLTIGPLEKDRLQQLLTRFLTRPQYTKLRMTWGTQSNQRRHIVLLQDGGRFLMAWIVEDQQQVRFHVADTFTYMDVEGKKYPKDTFQGRVTPAYLIHKTPSDLRNALEMLLANLEHPTLVTGKMAEYADEKPVKARPYGALWGELVADTL